VEVNSFEFIDHGGGQNDGPSPSHIADRELASLVNFYPYGQSLIRRNGVAQLTQTPAGVDITTPFSFKDSDSGVWALFGFSRVGLQRMDGQGFVNVGGAFADSAIPWCAEQYRNVGYAVRSGVGSLQRFTRDFMIPAGIAAPLTAPTLADGGAGSLAAATYRGVVTSYNRDTDAESNPCAIGTPLTTIGSKQIAWSSIPIPASAGQITSRRLYRTLPDQQGEYFFVAQIDDINTTTYTDNVVPSNLGRAASFSNGIPPQAALRFMRFWKERCWVADETNIYFSELGLPESFSGTSLIQVFPDNGAPITGLYPWGDRFVIAKSNLVAYVVGTDESDFALQVLSERHGVASHHSMRSAEGVLIWFGGDNFYRSAGEAPQAISNYKVRRIVDAIPAGQRSEVYAALLPKRAWYLASVPQAGGTRVVLCYNYKADAWAVFNHFSGIGFLADALDSDGNETVYAAVPSYTPGGTEGQHIFQYDQGNQDWGNAIVATLKSKAHNFQRSGKLQSIAVLRLLTASVDESITLYSNVDMATPPENQRTVSLARGTPMWKDYMLSNRRRPGAFLQYGLLYSGRTAIEIRGIGLDVMQTERVRGAA